MERTHKELVQDENELKPAALMEFLNDPILQDKHLVFIMTGKSNRLHRFVNSYN